MIGKKNIYDDAIAYDLMFGQSTYDLPFHLNQLTGHSKSVLELGCGTGRLTIPLALHGFDVTGIDIEDSMLARGKEKAAEHGVEIDWVHGDVRSFDLDKVFDAILFPCNSISHLLDSQVYYPVPLIISRQGVQALQTPFLLSKTVCPEHFARSYFEHVCNC